MKIGSALATGMASAPCNELHPREGTAGAEIQISNMVITFWFLVLKQKGISPVLLGCANILEKRAFPIHKKP
jgi:hypothetical protein